MQSKNYLLFNYKEMYSVTLKYKKENFKIYFPDS